MADYHNTLTDEFWCEHDGQSRILDPHKVADEIERLRAMVSSCRKAMQWAMKSKHGTDWSDMIAAIDVFLSAPADKEQR